MKANKMRTLTPSTIARIKAMILEGFTFSHIKDTIITNNLTIVYKDVVNVFHAMMTDKVETPELTFSQVKECYYKTEQDIFDEMEKEYKVEDLKGWEKEQLNKPMPKNCIVIRSKMYL